MQPISPNKFLRQLGVLAARNFRLIANNRLVLGSLVLQAPLMVLIIWLVRDPNCFTDNLVNVGSRTMLFVLCAVATFMGILNAYREICKEREIIFREASVGVSLLAVVLSKAMVLLLMELAQAAVLTVGFVKIIVVPQNHLLLPTDVEIYITVLLMMFSASCMGLLVSAALKSSESAILLVLVLIIGQVVFSGVLFPLSGVMGQLGTAIVCRWGMGALGASTDLNSRMDWIGLDSPMYEATVPNLVHSWRMLALLAVVCLAGAWWALHSAFKRRKG